MDDFAVVNKRSKRKCKKNSPDRTFLSRVCDIKSELLLTPFYQKIIDSLRTTVEEITTKCRLPLADSTDGFQAKVDLICYGLGNFTESYIARYQLALLMALRADIQKEDDLCEVFDPIFTDEEQEFLKKQNFEVSEENKEGKHRGHEDRVTVFFMPHCGKALYNNVLWRNWCRKGLQQIVVIGNSFTRMIERTPSRILSKTASYVIKMAPYIEDRALECPSDLESIFNDTSIQTFNTEKAPEVFWDYTDEPVYDGEDAEIIFASCVSRLNKICV